MALVTKDRTFSNCSDHCFNREVKHYVEPENVEGIIISFPLSICGHGSTEINQNIFYVSSENRMACPDDTVSVKLIHISS
jgi:hypothetical protein